MFLATACFADPYGDNPACNLDKVPLERAENCDEYLREDKQLNAVYKKLISNLDKASIAELRTTQKEWIKFRGDKCGNVLEKEASCTTAGCYGAQHDYCVIQLTSDRTAELRQFISDLDSAKAKKFIFSRKAWFDDDQPTVSQPDTQTSQPKPTTRSK
jgi:uncharacterized protein YecT (DUF1311 family)